MMKSSALCRHRLTKKRWSLECLVSILLIPLHCEGRPFHENSQNIIQVPLVAKISSMVEGVCMCMCARACVCVSDFVGG